MGGRRHQVIAMVSDAIYPYHRGGKELRYYELTRQLAYRAEIHVYTMHWWKGSPPPCSKDGVAFHSISRLLPLYVKGHRSLSQSIIFALCCLRLFRYNFDVLEADHIPFLQILPLRLIASIKRKRFVVTWHEVWDKEDWRRYLGRIGPVARFIETLTMRMPDHIIAASPETARRLQAILRGHASITIAPNGIDLAEVESTYPDATSTDLVVVGRLMAHKRIDMLLDVVALLHTDGSPVTCRVIGDGPEREALRAKATALGIGDAVDFRHDVSEQKEVYSLVKAAKIAVFPSSREGFGIAVLEALACGVPVITTSAPDNLAHHLVARSQRGVVCDPSAASIAAEVKHLLEEGSACDDEGSGSDTWLTEYSWEAMAEQVANALGI